MPSLTIKTVSGKVSYFEFTKDVITMKELAEEISSSEDFGKPSIELLKLIHQGKVLNINDEIQVKPENIVILMISKQVVKKPVQENSSTKIEENSSTKIEENKDPVNEKVEEMKCAPNPFNSQPEILIDEQTVAQLAVTQYMLLQSNPQLTDMISENDNLMSQILKRVEEKNCLPAGFEQLSQNPQIALLILVNYLKNIDVGKEQYLELVPLCKKLTKQMEELGTSGLIMSKEQMEELKNKPPDFDKMNSEQIQEYKSAILENQPELFDKLASMSDDDFKKMMSMQSKAKILKKKLDELEKEDPEVFRQAIQIKMMESVSSNIVLNEDDKSKIKEISLNFGFSEEEVEDAYISSGKNIDMTVNLLLG